VQDKIFLGGQRKAVGSRPLEITEPESVIQKMLPVISINYEHLRLSGFMDGQHSCYLINFENREEKAIAAKKFPEKKLSGKARA